MNPDNCTMRTVWPDPPQKGALGTELRVCQRPNEATKRTRRILRERKGRKR